MSAAFNLTTVIQLVAINPMAIQVFGEKLGRVEGIDAALAIVSVTLIMLGPALSRSGWGEALACPIIA